MRTTAFTLRHEYCQALGVTKTVQCSMNTYARYISYARMEECCLCSRSVAIGGPKKKQKRLYGTGCVVSRGILETLAGEEEAKRLAEIKGPHAFLCHVCEGKLQSVAKHEEQLGALRSEIHTLLQSALHPKLQRELSGHKRCIEDAMITIPVPSARKAPRIDPKSQQTPSEGVTEQPIHLEPPASSSDVEELSSAIQEQSSASHHQRSPPPTASLEQVPTSQEQTNVQQSPDITVCCATCMYFVFVMCSRSA